MYKLKYYLDKFAKYYYYTLSTILTIGIISSMVTGFYLLFILNDKANALISFLLTTVLTIVSNELKLDKLRQELDKFRELALSLLVSMYHDAETKKNVEIKSEVDLDEQI